MDKLEEMENFLVMHNLPRQNEKEIENMNRSIISNKIESLIKNT